MKDKKKIFLILSITLTAILLLVGITYAALSYTATSSNQQVILGDIYMYYNEMNQGITLEDALPTESYDSTKYFEFTIGGKNTYTKKDIWYDIVLTYGDAPEDAERTIRIRDNLLKFRLVEVNDDTETEIFTNKSFSDLSNRRVYVNTISKNTTPEIDKTYRLYMWISNETKVCSGNNVSNCDYYLDTTEETLDWNKVFASVKVNVTGDFLEKEVPVDPTDESCFAATKVINTYTYNDSDEAVSTCATYLEEQGFTIEGTYEDYCRGTDSTNSLKTDLEDRFNYSFESETSDQLETNDITYFINNNIMTDITYGAEIYGYDNSCGTESIIIPDTIGGYPVVALLGSGGMGNTHWGTYYTPVNVSYFSPGFGDLTNYRDVNGNILYGHNASAFGFYTSPFIDIGLKSVVIPDTVVLIGPGSFAQNNITSIKFPSNLKVIGENAFAINELVDIELPDSLQIIYENAFVHNNLSTVKIGSGIKYLYGSGIFKIGYWDTYDFSYMVGTDGMGGDPTYSNSNLKSITIDKTCSEIKSIKTSPSNSTSSYPWGANKNGVTIYGSNNEVCDTFS